MRLFGASLLVAVFLVPAFVAAQTPQPPSCQMSVTPSSIIFGGSTTLKWQSQGANTAFITGVGNVEPNGQVNLVPPGQGATFVGTFSGAGGTTTCEARVTVQQQGSSGGVDPGSSSGSGASDTGGGTIQGGGDTIQGGGTSGSGSQTSQGSPSTPAPSASQGSSQGSSQESLSGGLVPCTGLNCNLCSAGKLVQRVINFLIGLSIPLAALLFAWAGALYFSSGANPGNKEKAKHIFKDVVIGFAIALSAWLIVNTFLTIVFNKSALGGSFFNITCPSDAQRLGVPGGFTPTITQVLSSVLPQLSVAPTPNTQFNAWNPSASQYGPMSGFDPNLGGALTNPFAPEGNPCEAGYYYTADANEYWCQNNNGDIQEAKWEVSEAGTCPADYYYSENATEYWCQSVSNPNVEDNNSWVEATSVSGVGSEGRGVALCDASNPNCNVDDLMALGLTTNQANAMSCIAVTENAGQAVGCSGTGPCGTFQISKTNWRAYAPAECQASNFGGNIIAAQNYADCNAQTAAIMVQSNPANPYQPWTGNNNGVYWNTYARECVANYDPTYLK